MKKRDFNLRDLSSSSTGWSEKKRCLVPHQSGNPRVSLNFENCDKLSDKALDPDVVTMKQFIETGIPVDPSAFASVNQFQDPADLEQFLETHAGKLLDYAKRNKDAILSAIKGLPLPSPSPTTEPTVEQPTVEPAKND